MPSGSGVCGSNTMSAICDLAAAASQASSKTFAVAVSPRIGDEQYALLYDESVVSVLGGGTYPDSQGIHARPPYVFSAAVGAISMAVGVTHTRPTDAEEEIDDFPNVLSWMESTFDTDYHMLAGDYNSDGSYFDEGVWPTVLSRCPGFTLLTGNELDSTVASSSNSYDPSSPPPIWPPALQLCSSSRTTWTSRVSSRRAARTATCRAASAALPPSTGRRSPRS
ncbi:unnamed protein product [Prorocentrum cordatum]|uniref:Subtilisin n=1 Tax=Prorocentrum cordatum TaxID=2364126 RepID=A0ABN9RTN2_9DINO|nr:unnamed protein product [Polarella glacialis]